MHQDMKGWQQTFQELIQEVKPWHQWTLTLDQSLVPNDLQPGWTQYQQWGFARFQCSLCSRSWCSAQVQVLFHMHWSKRDSEGQVKVRVFSQRCQKCSQPLFEFPEFTDENKSRILKNLVFRILKKCYREGFESMEELPPVKDVYTEGPHDRDNCEACVQGFCGQRGLNLTTLPPKLPTISSPTFGIPAHEPSPTQSGTIKGTVTGDLRKQKRKVSPNPWFSEPWQPASPAPNTNHPAETRIPVPASREASYSLSRRHKKLIICCCLTILILIVILVVVIVVKISV